MASQQNMQAIGQKFKRCNEYSSDMGGFASSASEESSSGSESDSGDTSNEWRCGGSDDENRIEVQGKKPNKSLKKTLAKSSITMVTPNKYTDLATYIEINTEPTRMISQRR